MRIIWCLELVRAQFIEHVIEAVKLLPVLPLADVLHRRINDQQVRKRRAELHRKPMNGHCKATFEQCLLAAAAERREGCLSYVTNAAAMNNGIEVRFEMTTWSFAEIPGTQPVTGKREIVF
jgi:hypothetical protein